MIDTSKFFPQQSKEDQIELESWLENGRIQYLFKFMLENIVVDRPANVYRQLLNKINSWPVIKLSVVPFDRVSQEIPLSLAKFFNLERIDPDRIMAKEIKYNTEFGKRAKESQDKLGYHDEQIVFELVQSRIKYNEKQGKSWLLQNYPKTKNDAINLRLHGIFIDQIVCLKKEENYYENIEIFKEIYKNEFTEVIINDLTKGRITNAVKMAVYEAKKATVDTRPPAVWVIGPTLSGKTTIAQKLADHQDLFYFNLDGMNDIKVSNFIKETLISREVQERGQVLDGFPLTLHHQRLLTNQSIFPSHIVNLVISSDADVFDRNLGLYEDKFYPSVKIYFGDERDNLSKERQKHCPKQDEEKLQQKLSDQRKSIVDIDTNNYKVIKNFDAEDSLEQNINDAIKFIQTEEHATEIEMIKGKSEVDDAIKLLKLKFRNLGVPMIQVFSKFDNNGGGDLDKHEFTAMIQEVIPEISEELCFLIFDDFDLDKDGNVDQDEFLRKML